MATLRSNDAPRAGFAVWRIVVWLILLLAAYGCLQYLLHAQQLRHVMSTLPPSDNDDIAQLRIMFAWDVAYFVPAFALIVICAGAILRQAWSRVALQVACVVLAIGWGFIGGLHLYSQWHDFSQQVAMTNVAASLDEASRLAFDHQRRVFLIAMATKVAGIPVLLWLAWWLGRPQVRAQFRTLRR